VPDREQDDAHRVIDAAFSTIQRVQELMSFHDSCSELSRLNREAFQHNTQVHPWLYALLQRAQKIFLASDGLFDCTVADVLVQWAILPPQSVIPKPATQADVLLLPNNTIRYTKPLLIDLGGIAKGFAVDLAIHTLRQHGIKYAVVNAGGDLRVLGHHVEPISVRSPQNYQQLIPMGGLSAGAFATSGIYHSQRKFQDETVTALVNPKNRQAIMTPHSFSVIAPTTWLADALTKVVAITTNTAHPCLARFAASAFIID
jgi:thiamine biosynthesis lipoprotein